MHLEREKQQRRSDISGEKDIRSWLNLFVWLVLHKVLTIFQCHYSQMQAEREGANGDVEEASQGRD